MNTFFKPEQIFLTGSRTLSREYYLSAEIFASEIEHIFTRSWFCAGHVSRLPEAGDFFVLDAYGENIIILRDQNGEICAFYNVCRHRGTRMCEEKEGRFSKSIQCPYHAWTYSLDGKLIGAPLMKDVVDFNKDLVTPNRGGHMIFAMRVDNFRPVDEFKREMDRVIREIRDSKRMEGADRIWLPGEMEYLKVQERRRHGVPVAVSTVDQLRRLADELGLPDRLD